MSDRRAKRIELAVASLSMFLFGAFLLARWLIFVQATPQAPGVELGPDHTQRGEAGQTVLYDHTLTNTGPETDTFLLEVTSTQGWPVRLLGGSYPYGTALLPLQVGPQMTASFQVSLTVPGDAIGITEITIVTATSLVSPSVQDSAVDTTIVYDLVYLPYVGKRWPPMPKAPILDTIVNYDSDGYYAVSWTESSRPSADVYLLEEDDDQGFSDPTMVYSGTSNFWSVPAPGKIAGTYYYRARGQNRWGYGEYSNVVMANVLLPETPTLNPIDNPDKDGDYSVMWGVAARASSYVLEEDTDPTFSHPITVYQGFDRSWRTTKKLAGVYFYRARANGPTGESVWSSAQAVTVSAVNILPNYSHYVDELGDLMIYGEVRNNTLYYLSNIEISANLFDSNGRLVAEMSDGSVYLDNLAPGGETCFLVELMDAPEEWSYYEFESPAFWTDGEPPPNLAILNHRGSHEGYGYQVFGQLRNDHGTRVDGASAVSTAYDSTGKVIGCGIGYVNGLYLDPGEMKSFEVRFDDGHQYNTASYRLQPNGDPR